MNVPDNAGLVVLSQGDASILVTRPLTLILLILAALSLVGPLLARRRRTTPGLPPQEPDGDPAGRSD